MADVNPEELKKKPGDEMLQDLTDLKYEDFVKALGAMADDPKLQAAIKAGNIDGKMSDEKVHFTRKALAVNRLRPTQNEIDIDKSLAYPLENKFPDTTREILESNIKDKDSKGVEIIAPIVVLNNQYIIDGHHRWSQIYAMNAQAKVEALVMNMDEHPLDVLKAVQLSIAAKTKEVPVQTVEGTNMLKASEKQVKDYVLKNISDSTLKLLKETGKISDESKDTAADYIWSNVKYMQRTATPIKGAPDREFMPQTDNAEGGKDDWKETLKKGVINFKEPLKPVKGSARESRIHDFKTFVNEKRNK